MTLLPGAGVPVTSPQLYSAGQTDDLRTAILHISQRWPNAPLLGVGFSLGANVLTRYLAEEGDRSRLISGCAIGCVSILNLFSRTSISCLSTNSHGISSPTANSACATLVIVVRLCLLKLVSDQAGGYLVAATGVFDSFGWQSESAASTSHSRVRS